MFKQKRFILICFISVLIVSILKSMSSSKQLVSHTLEPKIGDNVVNDNPSCKHFKSVGIVTDVVSLKQDAGKVIVYEVKNKGATYCPGQTLIKTFDQLKIVT